jgi:16S rRNA U516 pseudouridylate synthase RsuA-like enzyme
MMMKSILFSLLLLTSGHELTHEEIHPRVHHPKTSVSKEIR